MATVTQKKPITFEEFCALVPDGQKADLIDGVIYVASPDNTDANSLFMWLGGLIYDFVQHKKLGKVYGERAAFRVNNVNAPEPDIAFVHRRRLGLVKRGYIDGPPDLAVEIVSPESEGRDYTAKKAMYEQAGVREYWIVDELKREFILLRRRKGKYHQARPRKGTFTSRVLPGFWLRPAWLWQQPLPNKLGVLMQILGKSS